MRKNSNKFRLALTSLTLLLSVLLIAMPVSANPGTLYVDDDYTDLTPGWGVTHFDHPQDAVNAGKTGDTVMVYPGTYDSRRFMTKPPHYSLNDQWAPALIVYKSDLTIQAVDLDPSQTVIQSTHDLWSNPVAIQASTDGALNSVASPNGVIVVADNVTIDGFTVISTYGGDPGAPGSNPNTAGVFIGGLYAGDRNHSGISGATIKNSVVRGHSGVRLWKAPNTTLTKNIIDNNMPVVAPGTTPLGAGVSIWDGWCSNPAYPVGGDWCEGPNVGSTGFQVLDNTITSYFEVQGIAIGGYYVGQMDHSDLFIDGNTINSSGLGVTFWGSGGTNKIMTCNNTVTVPDGSAQVEVWWGTYDGPFGLDTDSDGIPDCDDECPDSDMRETVVIDSCDSGVSNTVLPTGCTIADLVNEALATGHEDALEDLLEDLEDQGILTEDQAENIEDCAEDDDDEDDDDEDDDDEDDDDEDDEDNDDDD